MVGCNSNVQIARCSSDVRPSGDRDSGARVSKRTDPPVSETSGSVTRRNPCRAVLLGAYAHDSAGVDQYFLPKNYSSGRPWWPILAGSPRL